MTLDISQLKRNLKAKGRNIKPVPKNKEAITYFLACEGGTEKSYFSDLRHYLLDSTKVCIKFLDRTFSEQKRTKPTEILDLIYDEQYISTSKEIQVLQILQKTDHWLREKSIIPDFKLRPDILNKLITKMGHLGHQCGDILKFSDIENGNETKFFYDLKKTIENVLSDEINEFDLESFQDYLVEKLKNLGYVENVDKVCLICDRDFYDEEIYDNALLQCTGNNIGFYLTNPCFEFWILLHFKEIFEDDNFDWKLLLSNPMEEIPDTNKKERHSFIQLKSIFPEYSKSEIHFEKLVDNIKFAIESEKTFCEDPIQLKTKLGSRIGILVSELLAYSKES